MKADIAIITIREDEFEAVFDRLKKHQFKTLNDSSGRTYATFSVPTQDNRLCAVALARSYEQGADVSQQIASDMIRDLDPQLLLVVGIAGGVPHKEFTLGDVIISSRIHNFNLNAINQGVTTFNVTGGIHPRVSDITASLGMYRSLLTAWNELDSIGAKRPSVDLLWAESNVYGDAGWRYDVLQSLNTHFGESTSRSPLPLFKTGTIASSNSLIMDTDIPTQWLMSARSILAIEMESAGVLQAAQQMNNQYQVMAIRGISDIIGLKRDIRWTSYACQSAGAFTYAFIQAGIIKPRDNNPSVQPKTSPATTAASIVDSTKPAPLDLFISYSADDERFKKELEKHLVMLKRDGTIRSMDSQQTEAGLELEYDHIDQSQIILLLISPSFLASDYLYDKEMGRAMERHASGAARVVPIMIRSADIEETPFSKLVALPRSLQPIAEASNRDAAWTQIAREIRAVCNSLRASRSVSMSDQSPDIPQPEQPNTTTAPTYTQISTSPDRPSKPPSRIYQVGEVFVRKGTPDITFVESPDFKYLKQDLRPEGRSIVIEGPSGTGKTSAVRRAKAALGSSAPQPEYLSVHTKENREQLRSLATWHNKTLIIDDFHWLDEQLYRQIADYLKFLADTDSTTKKLVIIGIPNCGQALIDMAPDLATRFTHYKWQSASDEVILELIEKGEKALNIEFASKAEIMRTASGSLFVAQSLCYNLCIEAGIEKTQSNTTIINCPTENGIRRTKDELATKFRQPVLRFAALGDKDTTCLDLLQELAYTKDGMLSLRDLSIRRSEIEPGIKRFINENWMEGLKKDYPRIAEVLFYQSIGHALVVEDPQLTFYLRRISFAQLAKEAGKTLPEAGQKPRLFICYNKSEALLLENLLLGLTHIRNQVTIDSWNDNDIFSGVKDLRDLEISIKSSTFALILVSQKFLIESGFMTDYNLLKLLQMAATNNTTVVPIIAAPCLFEDSGLDQFKAYKEFTNPDRSLAEMTDIERDRVFVQLAILIRKKLQKP